MTVDVLALTEQCIRFSVTPDIYSTLVSAHALLAKLPTGIDEPFEYEAPIYALQWLEVDQWQAELDGSAIETGSLENCVTAIAKRCKP